VVARPVTVQQNAPVVPVVPIPSSTTTTTTVVHQQPVVAQAYPVAPTNRIPTLNMTNAELIESALEGGYNSYPYNPEYSCPHSSNLNNVTAPAPVPAAQHPTGTRMLEGTKWGSFYGQFNNRGERHGFGTMKYDDGSQYEGLWKNNLKDGSGTFIYSSGPKLVATWVENKVNGSATFYYTDGRVDLRKYCKDECIGVGVQYSQDRQVATKLNCGRVKKWISLTEASRIASRLGLAVPR